MLDLVALVGAIVLVIVVLQLRAALAMPFARRRYAVLAEPPHDAADALFAQLHAQALALGFEGPTWLRAERVDGGEESFPVRAVYGRADGLGRLVVLPPYSLAHPHRLLTWFEHRLDDGRIAVSQAYDVFYALVQGGALVARTGIEPDLAWQWRAHQDWIAGLGSAPVAASIDTAAADAEAFDEAIRTQGLADGRLRAVNDDLALPRLGFAWRILRAHGSAPKPPPDPRPVPVPRLARLAALAESVRHRSPPRDVQWGLFLVSVALFAVLGALIWDPVFAAGLLLVVLVHELGHFAAMRAFGYRNTHILALPLVGGVAMGHDADPSATRRAWMSLMGPLPGILIGWGLLLAIALGRFDAPWSLSLATTFLLVNYLNVLPMPPLDGAHVLEALLPARWARLQTVVIGAFAVAGGLIATYFGLYVLTFLAFIQLFALVGSWRLHGVERTLAGRASLALRPRDERMGQILGELDAKLGPTPQAATRVNQALQVAHRLEMKPMGALARTATGLVYAALLVVPVGVGVVWLHDASAAAPPGYDEAAMAARMAEQQAQQVAWRKEAKAMPLPALLKALSDVPGFNDELKKLPAPATPAQFDAAQARLGAPLPAQLRALYALADGVPAAGIAPLAEVAPADVSVIKELAYDGNLHFNDDGGLVLPAASVQGWWHLGGDEEAPLFYLPTPPRELPGKHIVSLWLESPSTHADLRDYLEMRLVEQRQAADYEVRWTAARARAAVALANTPTPALLAAWDTPPAPLLTRFILAARGVDGEAGPASDADLRAAEARLGAKLPAELAAVLRVHDGFRPLQLRPAADLVRWPAFAATDPRRSTPWLSPGPARGEGGEALTLDSEAAIAHCVVVAGRDGKPERAGMAWAGLLWCPDGKPAAWVDPRGKRGYATLRDWLLPQAAQVRAAHHY